MNVAFLVVQKRTVTLLLTRSLTYPQQSVRKLVHAKTVEMANKFDRNLLHKISLNLSHENVWQILCAQIMKPV